MSSSHSELPEDSLAARKANEDSKELDNIQDVGSSEVISDSVNDADGFIEEIIPAKRPRHDDEDQGLVEIAINESTEEEGSIVVVEGIASDAMAQEPEDQEPADGSQAGPSTRLVVRYGLMRQIGEFRHALAKQPGAGQKVVIRSERGVELGEVLIALGDGECEAETSCRRCISGKTLSGFIQDSGPEYPFRRDGKVLRLANSQDVSDQRHLDSSAREETSYCRQQIREMKLAMRLVTVEHLLGGERIIFYFSSDTRVDFRELVRRLALQYRTRIEMRQVGARDEARLVADYERCGQRCCCQEYLKNLKPVSMRMAKTQKATLDPSKISGRCGRLMCCLRYEDIGYEELRKQLPRKNTWVRTSAGVVGKVIDGQILTQLVRLLLIDNTQVVVEMDEIADRDIPAPVIPVEERRPVRERKEKGPTRLLREEFNKPATLADSGTLVVTPLQGQPPADAAAPDGAVIGITSGAVAQQAQADDDLGDGDDTQENGPDEPIVGNAPVGPLNVRVQGQPQGNRQNGQNQDGQGSGRRRRRRRRRPANGQPAGRQGQQGSNGQSPPPPAAGQ